MKFLVSLKRPILKKLNVLIKQNPCNFILIRILTIQKQQPSFKNYLKRIPYCENLNKEKSTIKIQKHLEMEHLWMMTIMKMMKMVMKFISVLNMELFIDDLNLISLIFLNLCSKNIIKEEVVLVSILMMMKTMMKIAFIIFIGENANLTLNLIKEKELQIGLQ